MSGRLAALWVLACCGFAWGAGAVPSGTVPTGYQWTAADAGAALYVDRDYVLEALPSALAGAWLLQAKNDDKTASKAEHIAFELEAPSVVYVGWDERAAAPDWLGDWVATGDRLSAHEAGVFALYEKAFPAGRVVLGGNAPAPSHYVVLVKGEKVPCAQCVPRGEVRLSLAWDANPEEDRVTHYHVYRGADESAALEVGAVAGEQTRVAYDAHALGLKYGDRVCFRVKARNRCNEGGGAVRDCYSGFSNAACARLEEKEALEEPKAPTQIKLEITLSIGGEP